MACPNCDHTMQRISGDLAPADTRVFWCPRCGTIKDNMVSVPELAIRLVQLLSWINERFGENIGDMTIAEARRIGIIELITLSDDDS